MDFKSPISVTYEKQGGGGSYRLVQTGRIPDRLHREDS